jgi:UDP-N-acetyl-D-mannosaminuronate dehydrogenase
MFGENNLQLKDCVKTKNYSGNTELVSENARWKKVLIVGLGQIGLPVAKYVSEKGFDAYGFDISDRASEYAKVAGIQQTDSFGGFDVYIICVPTHKANDIFRPQVESLFSVVKKIGKEAPTGSLISIESTIPRGTSKKVFDLVNHRLHVAHVPHRWYSSEQETHGVNQLRVAGGVCDCCLRMAVEFYSGLNGSVKGNGTSKLANTKENPLVSMHGGSTTDNISTNNSGINEIGSQGSAHLLGMTGSMEDVAAKLTKEDKLAGCDTIPSLGISLHLVPDIDTAEVTKVTENAHRFLQIAFAEELYIYCRANNINFFELREALNSKWNVEILEPREGIGGHCLPKDTRMFLQSSRSVKSKILNAAIKVDEDYQRIRCPKDKMSIALKV